MVARVSRRFGVLLRKARTEKRVTTRALGELSGSSNAQVTNWELGRIPHPFNEERVDTLARVLDADRDELFRALVVEQFVIGLPDPLLKDLREELIRTIATYYSDHSGMEPGLALGSYADRQRAGHKPLRIRRRSESIGIQADVGDESLELQRRTLIEALAESDHMEESLARAALRGEAAIPAEEVELLVGRLFNAVQVADLLLILQVQVVVDMRGGSDAGRPVLRLRP